jgi:hypothetical protein
MAKLINIQTVERFDYDSPEIIVFGYCSNCAQTVYQQIPSVFPERCPYCNEKIEEVKWNNSK